MSTITLYANKVNRMPGLLSDAKKAVKSYKSDLTSLKSKVMSIDRSVCNVDNIISTLQSSTQTQEQKITSLENFKKQSDEFIADTVRADNNVADMVEKSKDKFYDKFSYLKPECEKDWKEKTKDWFASVGAWCKEHWKAIVTAVIVIAAIVCLFIPGVNAWVLGLACGKLILAMAVGSLLGAGIGGLFGGVVSVFTGGSFWQGFEEGAFFGAISGIISGGMGFAMSAGGTLALNLGQTLIIGGVSGAGTSLISDLGDRFFKGENISFSEMILNMTFSGIFGAAFAGIGYGITRSVGALFKNASWFSKAKELFKIGKTSNPSYGKITSYTTSKPAGISLNIANGEGKSIFRVEFDAAKYLHYHIPSMFGTKAHLPLSPIIDSTISRISQYFIDYFRKKK